MAVTLLQSFEKLERTVSTELVTSDGQQKFPIKFWRNFVGVGAFTLGQVWGLSGMEKFPFAMNLEKMSMILAVSKLSRSNWAYHVIDDFVPNEPSPEHPDYQNTKLKYRYQNQLATWSEKKVLVS